MQPTTTLFFQSLSAIIGTATARLGRGASALAVAALAAATILGAGCSGATVQGGAPLMAPPPPTDQTARDAAAWLVGDYSSAQQAAEDPNYFDIRLHIVRIWRDRTDGAWLYVEQAMANAQATPYRQRVYHVITAPNGAAESVVFELPGDPLSYAGAWSDPARLNALDPALLVPRAGCSVILKRSGPGQLSGATSGDGCGSNLRGAAYATSEVTLTPLTLRSWDRGYDRAGKQVWGAVKGPYAFVKEAAAAKAAVEVAPMVPTGAAASADEAAAAAGKAAPEAPR